MEENTLEIKIRKQLDFIKQEISSFKRAFNGKQLKQKNFIPYLEALNKAFDLNNSYGQDYYEFIEKKNLFFILKNNRELMNDICFKLKNLSLYFQQLNVQTKEKPKKNDGICSICQQHIDSQNVQQAKNSVEDVGINKLKRMLKIMEQQGNMAMFSVEEDKHFFQQLHRVLTKKQQILSITDNHLQKYLNDIVKNMQEIKYLQNLKDTTFSLPQCIDWQTKIKNQINLVLLGSFKGKVPTWIQKTFDYFIKLHSKFMRQMKQTKQCQTQSYTQDQVFQLRDKMKVFKESQKTNKSLIQNYLKSIQEKEQKIKKLQIQIDVLKGHLNNENVGILSKSGVQLNSELSKQQKSYRNSSIKDTIEEPIGLYEKSKSQHRFKKISKMSSLINDPLSQSSMIQQLKGKLNESELITQNMNKTFANQLKKQSSVTQNLSQFQSTIFEQKINRKKHKKFTDIEYFKKTMQNQSREKFLPNLQKIIKDSNGQQIPQQIKKTSIMSSNYQFVNKPSQKIQISQRHEIPTLREKQIQQRSINQLDQDTEKCIAESEINLIEKLTDSQRKIRLKQYKQKVSDVQYQLENKVHKIEALKKTFQLKKLHTSSSFTAKTSPFFNELSPLNKMIGQRFASSIMSGYNKKPEMKDSMTQTQKEQDQKTLKSPSKSSLINKKSPRAIRIKTEQQACTLIGENQSYFFTSNGMLTKQSLKQSIFKKFVDNENLLKISEDHLEKVLSKLLFIDGKNNQHNNRSLIKSTHRDKSIKSKKILKPDNSLNESILQKTKRNQQKENKNQKSSEKQNNLPQIFNVKEISLKQKVTENNVSRDPSPTTKSKKTAIINENPDNLPNISGFYKTNQPPCCLFTKKDFSLFISEQNSFKYESNMSKKYHKTPSTQLTKEETQKLTSVYGLTQIIKSHSQKHYNQIISFLKYPYHTVVNDFSILNMIKDMSLDSWLWHFSMIKYYHQKCLFDNNENKCICNHIEKFINKIQEILVDIIKPQIEKQHLNQSEKV